MLSSFKTTNNVYKYKNHLLELRYLGIYIPENLKLGYHDRLLREKLCKVVYMMETLKETMIRNIYY
jgi:hypothetical protein